MGKVFKQIVGVNAIVASFFVPPVAGFALSIIGSSIISRTLLANNKPDGDSGIGPENLGNRQQLPPAGNNKLPIIFGSAYTGGIITDFSITKDSQVIYYVFSLCEVTGLTSASPDTFSFGNIYWEGKRCIFDNTDRTRVIALLDESTGNQDTTVNGKMNFYLYRNGSLNPTNTSLTAVQVMQDINLTYRWDDSKLMSNTVFAILRLQYSDSANIRGLGQTRFQVINSRYEPGYCIMDYLQSSRYGCGLATNLIDYTSLNNLNTYCNQTISYIDYNGVTQTLPQRFRFDGVIDTNQTCMQILQAMALCCDALIKYNEITGQWGVVVQQPTYAVQMDINDSNIISPIQITPLDISSSINISEVQFSDGSEKDSFSSAIYDLRLINPSLLFPNEPINQQSFILPLVNNSVRAQLIANRILEGAREDLQMQVEVGFVGIQLEAGDIVTVTNSNYGFNKKLFRINRLIEKFSEDGVVSAQLALIEWNPAVYDDITIKEFRPSPNTGLADPLAWGTLLAPRIVNPQPSIANPSFDVLINVPTSGVTQYAEVWYSAFANPTPAQLLFYGTSAVQPAGLPYAQGITLPAITMVNIPRGDWYVFARMVNSIKSSNYSPASDLISWRPTTIQFQNRYVAVAYGTSAIGANFSFLPTNATFYGLANQTVNTASNRPADYQWFPANPVFGNLVNFLVYRNQGGRKFTFATGTASLASGSGRFVPTQTNLFDPSSWSALLPNTNIIDLDQATGQITQTGTTSVGTGAISTRNTNSGQFVASLNPLLNLGAGITVQSVAIGDVTAITFDNFGRVLALTKPDRFILAPFYFVSAINQTVFNCDRTVAYFVGQSLVFRNGVLLDETEYTDSSTGITLASPATAGDLITIIGFLAISNSSYLEPLFITVKTITNNQIVYNFAPNQTIQIGDVLRFGANATGYVVQAFSLANKTITFTANLVGVNANDPIYRTHPILTAYRPFTRIAGQFSNASGFSSDTFYFVEDNDLLFNNGCLLSDADYDLTNQTYYFKNILSGNLTLIQFAFSNINLPAGNVQNITAQSVAGQTIYEANINPNSFLLYANGLIFSTNGDYQQYQDAYVLAVAFPDNNTLISEQTYAIFTS